MIKYTRHAKDRMKERGITEAEAEYCIGNYEICYQDLSGNTVYKTKLADNRQIKVVANTNSVDQIVVITVAN